jgi:two-component system, NarL family, nitrate/nitrite response regulator NarL
MSKSIRVVVVDDHAIIREGLRMLLDSDPDIEVVGDAANVSEAMTTVARERPDMIILDLDLGGESGLTFLADLAASKIKTRVLILTGTQDAEVHRQAVHLGAVGIVQKSLASKTLIKAVRKVHDGEVWLDRMLTAAVLNEMTYGNDRAKDNPEAAKIATLTEREREVIALIGESLKTHDIAGRLFISEKTVRNHLASIYSKLNVSDRFDLVVYAYRHKLAHPPH